MNDKLEETLGTILEKALTLAEQTGEFVMEQAPQLLQEFYAWHTAKAIFMGITFLIVTLILVYLSKRCHKGYKNADYSDEGPWLFGEVFSIAGVVLFFCFTMSEVYTLVYINVAPKLYLIDYFMHPSGC